MRQAARGGVQDGIIRLLQVRQVWAHQQGLHCSGSSYSDIRVAVFPLQPEGPQEGQLPPVDSFSAGEGASSSDPADHGWPAGQGRGSSGEESGISVDCRGGTRRARCGDGYDSFLLSFILHCYDIDMCSVCIHVY